MDNQVAPVPGHLRGILSKIIAACKVRTIHHLRLGGEDLLLVVYADDCPNAGVRTLQNLNLGLTTSLIAVPQRSAEHAVRTPAPSQLKILLRTGRLLWHDRSA